MSTKNKGDDILRRKLAEFEDTNAEAFKLAQGDFMSINRRALRPRNKADYHAQDSQARRKPVSKR